MSKGGLSSEVSRVPPVSMQAEKVEEEWDGGGGRAVRERVRKTRACWWRKDAGTGGQTDARESRGRQQTRRQVGNSVLVFRL